MRKVLLLAIVIAASLQNFAQPIPVVKETITANRERLHRHIVNNTINGNLSSPLADSTEDRWEDAFYALELIHLKTPWVNQKITAAVSDMQNRSISFQRALLELLYANYQQQYRIEITRLYRQTSHPKIFAMSGEYLLKGSTVAERNLLLAIAKKKAAAEMGGPLLEQLIFNIGNYSKKDIAPSIHTFLKKDYLPGNVLMISFQRRNRDYPGLVIVRDTAGRFVRDTSGKFFSITQLARSINNLPGYITNGNTPTGIFRMDGFDVSKGSMIGPTTNVQLTMPFEYNAFHFYRDSTLADTIGNITLYKNLLPANFREYYSMQQSFYAGKAGRTEIIAHGTTVDPAYYNGLPYYPLTPTMGCLCTKEIWNGANGQRIYSDQQLLINAITAAGGPNGYAIVINIDDKQAPVTLNDILPYLKMAGQK